MIPASHDLMPDAVVTQSELLADKNMSTNVGPTKTTYYRFTEYQKV